MMIKQFLTLFDPGHNMAGTILPRDHVVILPRGERRAVCPMLLENAHASGREACFDVRAAFADRSLGAVWGVYAPSSPA